MRKLLQSSGIQGIHAFKLKFLRAKWLRNEPKREKVRLKLTDSLKTLNSPQQLRIIKNMRKRTAYKSDKWFIMSIQTRYEGKEGMCK